MSKRLGRAVLALFMFSASSTAMTAGVELVDTVVLGGKMSLLIPVGFAPMGEAMLQRKYPSTRRPSLVYTNMPGTVNVTINHTHNAVEPAQLPKLRAALASVFERAHPGAIWLRNEMTQIGERPFFLLDLRTKAADTQVRNIIVGTSAQGRMLLVSVNATHALESDWMPVAERIMRSVRVTVP